MAAFKAALMSSPASLVAHLCMLHVLTDVRSSRALRLWSASQFRRQIAAGSSGTQLSSALEHPVQRETTGAAQREWKCGLERGLPLAAAVLDGGDGGLLPAVR